MAKVSVAFLAEYYKINPDSLIYREGYEDQEMGVKHAWVDQTFVCSLPVISSVVIHYRYPIRMVSSSQTPMER